MLTLRILSAVLLLPLLLWGFIDGSPLVVVAMVCGFTALSVGEIIGKLSLALEAKLSGVQITEYVRAPPRFLYGLTLALALLFITMRGISDIAISGSSLPQGWASFLWSSKGLQADEMVFAGIFLVIGVGVFSGPSINLSLARTFAALLAFCYGTIPWLIVLKLYQMGPHAQCVILVMAVTWMGDTGAYFGGRFFGTRWFGSRPFAPEISPKKTWEGSLVGLGFSLLAAIVTHLVFDEAFGSWALIVAVGILGGISAQLGDLVESGFKRFAGVKDSGSLIPGHGGFLDRVDGTFFCGPMIWVLLRMFGGN